MKTILTNKLARLSGLTMAIMFPLAAIAADAPTGKGAAKLLMKPQPAVSASAQPAMSCALCKDEFTMRKDVSARGATKPTVNVVRHLCPTCETKLAVSGHGKAKRDVVTHVCTSGGAKGPTCCSTK